MQVKKIDKDVPEPVGMLEAISDWDNPDPALMAFLETLQDGVSIFGSDRHLKFCNASFRRLFGLAEEACQPGTSLRTMVEMIAERGKLVGPGDMDQAERIEHHLAIWSEEAGRVERRHIDDGQILDIYRTRTHRGDMVSIHVDVTEQIRAEQQIASQQVMMKSLLENTSDGITLLDASGNFAMFNDRMLELYDVNPEKVHWGISYDKMVAQFGDMQHLAPAARERETARRRKFAFDPKITTIRRHLKDGRTLNINKTVLPNGGCVMTIRDMTAELAREEELVKARFTAEESSRHKSEFVARMSHEMRTPLNGILGVAALMERTELTEKQQALVDVISSSGKVLLRLIDDILDLSRLDADSFDVVAERLIIGDVVRQCLSIIEPAANEQGLELRFIGDPEHVPPLKGDNIRIKQILLNLLTNAVKFTEKGFVELAMEHEAGPEGVTLTLTVTDSGVGIPGDKLDQIFNRFYQIDGTVTRRRGGAGLGLAITRKLVDAMGGTIQVSSTPGSGAVFRVRLTLPPAGRLIAVT